jgi:predicted hydrolase (HD superfamily)
MSLKLDRQVFGDPANAGKVLSREEAERLLNEWVLNDRLKLHMHQVGHLMRNWALERRGADEGEAWRWELAGLLHDADWDQWPDEHCRKIVQELERRQVDPEVIRAIASHGPAHFGVDPQTDMDKMLFAFDELSGFVHAYSLMRPEGYRGMEVKGVKKRLKDKAFAANVSREEIADAAQRAGLDLDELLRFIIAHQANRSALD